MAKKTKKNKVDRYIDSLHSIDDKLVVITGANSGLGYEIARVALLKGARVVMACRSLERAEASKNKLIEDTKSEKIEIFQYDQSDFKSVERFSDALKTQYKDFYALILNAGLFLPKEVLDEYHVSIVYRNNFLGAYALLKSLEDFINESEHERRVIIQGSLASFVHKYKNKDNFIYGNDRPMKQYALSKLCCSNMYVYYKNRNFNPNVKYLLSEPGVAATGLFKTFKEWFRRLTVFALSIVTNDAREGSLSACKLMCDLAANGDYYKPKHFFSSTGLPKKSLYSKKYIFENIISDADEMLKQYQ